jgi:hypothetical protein
MLLLYSPNLTSLTLSANSRINLHWRLEKFLLGRWPKLRQLDLTIYHGDEVPQKDIIEFLYAHPNLTSVSSVRGISFSKEALSALPNLEMFRTKIQRLKDAEVPESLNYLYLTVGLSHGFTVIYLRCL